MTSDLSRSGKCREVSGSISGESATGGERVRRACRPAACERGIPEWFEARWEGKAGKGKTGPFRTAFPVPDGAFLFGVPAKGVFCAVFQAVQRMRALLCRKPAVRMLRTAPSFYIKRKAALHGRGRHPCFFPCPVWRSPGGQEEDSGFGESDSVTAGSRAYRAQRLPVPFTHPAISGRPASS